MLIDIMKVFHDFCERKSLRYYAIDGTALGAARHHGFIPWDDDLDVGMPRPDYERFISIFDKENTNKRYILETPDSADTLFAYSYSKLYDTQTTLIEYTRHPLKRGLYIDVFPLDGAGSSEEDALPLFKTIKRLSFLRNMRVIKISKERKLSKNLTLAFFQAIPDAFLHEKRIAQKINTLSQTIQYDSSVFVTNYASAWGERELVQKKIFGNPVLSQFENIVIYCPEDVDAYLMHVYGDWRTPPPKEKQITHHNRYLDLSSSYLE